MQDTEFKPNGWTGGGTIYARAFCGDCGALTELSDAWLDESAKEAVRRRKRAKWIAVVMFLLSFLGWLTLTIFEPKYSLLWAGFMALWYAFFVIFLLWAINNADKQRR